MSSGESEATSSTGAPQTDYATDAATNGDEKDKQ